MISRWLPSLSGFIGKINRIDFLELELLASRPNVVFTLSRLSFYRTTHVAYRPVSYCLVSINCIMHCYCLLYVEAMANKCCWWWWWCYCTGMFCRFTERGGYQCFCQYSECDTRPMNGTVCEGCFVILCYFFLTQYSICCCDFGCQCQYNRLLGKTPLWNYLLYDLKVWLFRHSLLLINSFS